MNKFLFIIITTYSCNKIHKVLISNSYPLLGHKLHQLQKRYKRARLNGYTEKQDEYKRRIEEVQEKLKYLYPKADYMQAPPDASDYAIGALKTVGKVAAKLFSIAPPPTSEVKLSCTSPAEVP